MWDTVGSSTIKMGIFFYVLDQWCIILSVNAMNLFCISASLEDNVWIYSEQTAIDICYCPACRTTFISTRFQVAVSSIGRVFRSLLWRWRKMAALPLPVAILDDLISGSRSSKMATGSGRAAIFLHLHNRDRKTRPRFWMTSFPASPSWIQDGGGGNDVRRTSRRSWRRSTDVCPHPWVM